MQHKIRREAEFAGMPCLSWYAGRFACIKQKAIDFAIKTALATNCTVNEHSIFARKNYFYPDLPKNYQISQYELPLAIKGCIEVVLDGNVKKIGITRIHMEEDAGKNLHEGIIGCEPCRFKQDRRSIDGDCKRA